MSQSLVVSAESPQWFAESRKGETAVESQKLYEAELSVWHGKRIDGLTKADGYLSLVGLHWLTEGPTDISGIGRVYMEGETAVVESLAGWEYQEKPAQMVRLDSRKPEGTNLVTKGTLSYYVIRRGPSFALRVKDSQSLTRVHFSGVPRFPVDRKWRLLGRLEKAPSELAVDSVVGIATQEKTPGRAVFNWAGKEYRPILIGEPNDKKFFLVFTDRTAGKSTYPACRFLGVERGDGDTLILDFNKSTNPACAFTSFATCPLPPAENEFPFSITAGEKRPKGH